MSTHTGAGGDSFDVEFVFSPYTPTVSSNSFTVYLQADTAATTHYDASPLWGSGDAISIVWMEVS